MFLLTSTKKSFSTEEIRHQLGHKRYQPIWEMVCKLRDVMDKRDEHYRLTGSEELDEVFFTVELQEEEMNKPLKRGRGSQRKAKILVMVESSNSTKTYKRGRPNKTVGHLKMQVISDLGSKTITIAICNAKRLLLDVHHNLKNEYLQYYLNEFCYKFNRRHLNEKMFDRLTFTAINYKTDFSSRTYKRTSYR